jgi:hypothetical protein
VLRGGCRFLYVQRRRPDGSRHSVCIGRADDTERAELVRRLLDERRAQVRRSRQAERELLVALKEREMELTRRLGGMLAGRGMRMHGRSLRLASTG